jgi:hypothetical protein
LVPEPADGATDVALQYAPGAPVRRRRRRRRVLALALVSALSCLAFWQGPTLWRRAWTAHVTRQACEFEAAPGTAVYADRPSGPRPLIPEAGVDDVTGPVTVAHDPAVVARLVGISADPRIFSMFAHAPSTPGPLAFLHERTLPEGRRVLVAIRLRGLTWYPERGGLLALSYSGLEMHPNGSRPPTLITLSRAWGGVNVSDPAALPANRTGTANPGPIKIYFGSPDPNDDSAFTIPYEVGGGKGTWRFRVSERGIELEDQAQTSRE